MADSYYYQANGQPIGPLAPAALKQLANEGVIVASTPVRKGEQGAWYQAGTIAGLVPPQPAEVGGSSGFETNAAERARQTFRHAEVQAEKVAAQLWFLDLKFSQLFAPKLIGAVWALYLCLVVVFFFASTAFWLSTLTALQAFLLIIVEFIALPFSVIFTRVILEVFLVIFRIAERLESPKQVEPLEGMMDHGK